MPGPEDAMLGEIAAKLQNVKRKAQARNQVFRYLFKSHPHPIKMKRLWDLFFAAPDDEEIVTVFTEDIEELYNHGEIEDVMTEKINGVDTPCKDKDGYIPLSHSSTALSHSSFIRLTKKVLPHVNDLNAFMAPIAKPRPLPHHPSSHPASNGLFP